MLRRHPLPSFRVMKKRLLLLALGAFFVPASFVAGCGGVPGNAVATVDGNSIEKSAFDHWLTVASKSGGQAAAAAPKPPEYTDCVKQKRKTTPKPAKGQPKVTDAALKKQCKQEYDALRDQVHAAARLLRVDRGRGQGAEHQGLRQGDPEDLRQAEEGGVPQGSRLREVPQGLRPDRGGHPQARPPRHPLQQDPREGHQGQGQGLRRRDRRPTTTRTRSASRSPSGATSASS